MIRDESAARKVLAEINKESQELLKRSALLHEKIGDLQKFYRQDANEHKAYGNAWNLRSAASELHYVTTAFPKFMSYLKRLANYAYPLIVAEEEDDESEQSSLNKIDKNAKVVKPTIPVEDVETVDENLDK